MGIIRRAYERRKRNYAQLRYVKPRFRVRAQHCCGEERFFIAGYRKNTAFWAVTRALTTKCQYINNSCSVREGRDDQGVNKEKNCLSVSLKKCDEPLHPLRYARLHLQRWPGGSTRGWLRVVAYGRCRVVTPWDPHIRNRSGIEARSGALWDLRYPLVFSMYRSEIANRTSLPDFFRNLLNSGTKKFTVT